MTASGQSFAGFLAEILHGLRAFAQVLPFAILLVLSIGWIGGQLYLRRRESADRAETNQASERARIAQEFNLPKQPDTAEYVTLPAKTRSSIWRAKLHGPSIGFKNVYLENIGRCGVLLAFIFLLLALELTVLRWQHQLKYYSATVDLCAISLVLMFWWRARSANQAWIRRRITSELMRQWLHMTTVFPWAEDEVERGFRETSERLETMFVTTSAGAKRWLDHGLGSKELERRISDFWLQSRAGLAARIPLRLRDLLTQIEDKAGGDANA